MNKIKITKISDEVYKQKGYDKRGCYNTKCDDKCCLGGCDMDKETYDLVIKHRKIIEKELGINLDKCFKNKWSGDKDYLGEDSIETAEGKNGLCIFHMPDRKCCVLYKLVIENNLPRRMIPSICRLYPLNWDNGLLYVYEDIEKSCNCQRDDNRTKKNAFETQKNEMEDICDIANNA